MYFLLDIINPFLTLYLTSDPLGHFSNKVGTVSIKNKTIYNVPRRGTKIDELFV
jgi:hypothetical protein